VVAAHRVRVQAVTESMTVPTLLSVVPVVTLPVLNISNTSGQSIFCLVQMFTSLPNVAAALGCTGDIGLVANLCQAVIRLACVLPIGFNVR
jgi:hypothetical protein